MTASPDRRRASAHSLCTGGTLLALACARNVYAAIDRSSPEAGALATWLGQSATAFGLPDSALPSDGDEPGRSRRRGVNLQDWRKIRLALNLAVADLPRTVDSPAERWIAAIGKALRLDPLAKRILALAIHYKVDQRVERLFDGISACRGGHSMLHRDAGLFGLLLDEPTAEVASQFSAHAKLLASGLLHLDEHGQLSVLDRLQSLIRQDVLPAADFYDQLLGSIEADPLPWDSFAHLGREAEIAVSLLQATLAGGEIGVSILLYGPPGTGKTSFAATLAARVGARLRPICEADERGGEPSRSERLAGLRLAQRLATPANTVLLFDEAEDIFVNAKPGIGTHTTSSRVFIHRLLERLTVPVIWTANDIEVLGPAVLRRMTMCLELKVPNVATRTLLWRRMGEAEGIALKEADAARLARLVPAAPAVASASLRATRLVWRRC